MAIDGVMESEEYDSLQKEEENEEKAGLQFEETNLFKILVDVGPNSQQKIKECMDNGEDIHKRGKYDETYLHVLCAPVGSDRLHYIVPVIYQLADSGIDINAKDKEGNTPLHVSAINDLELDICAAFLRLGSNPLAKNNYDQLPVDLAENDEMKELIKYYQPGLWQAVKNNDIDCVKKLIHAWSWVNLKQNRQRLDKIAKLHDDNSVYTHIKEVSRTSKLITKALSGNSKAVKEILKEKNDNVNVDIRDGYISQISGRRWPLLAEVLRLQLWDSAKVLTKFADVNQEVDSVDGETFPLFEWVMKSVPDLDESFLKALLKRADFKKANSLEILYGLLKKGHSYEIIEYFIKAGFSISDRDSEGLTLRDRILLDSHTLEFPDLQRKLYAVDKHVINLAKEGKVEALCKLLLDGYDYLLVSDLKNQSITDIAAARDQLDVEEFLKSVPQIQKTLRDIQKSIELGNLQQLRQLIDDQLASSKDRGGRSLLHIAMLYERTFIIKYLMKKYPGLVQCKDNHGRTPLHYAVCLHEMDDLEEQLCLLGADECAPDKEGNTPMEYKMSPMALEMIKLEREKNYGKDAYFLYNYLLLVDIIKNGFDERLASIIQDLSGIDLNKVNKLPDSFGELIFRPLLFLCVENDQPSMAMALIKAGADFNIAAKIPGSDRVPRLVTLQETAEEHRQTELVEFLKKRLQREEERIRSNLAFKQAVKKMSNAHAILEGSPNFSRNTNSSMSPPPIKRPNMRGDENILDNKTEHMEATSDPNMAKSATCAIL